MNNKWLIRGTLIIVPLFLTFFHWSVIKIESDGESYFLNSDSFTLTWIHSVENEPWYEVYERDGRQLVLTETYFKTFGAGVPSEGEIIESDDGFIRMAVNREMSQMNMIVSDHTETTILTDTKEIPLYELFKPYSEIEIKVQRVYLWNMWGGKPL